MADTPVDRLKIEIEASASKAEKSVDKLVEYLNNLKQAISGVDTNKFSSLAGAITSLADGMKNMPSTASWNSLYKGIEKLSGIDTSGLDKLSNSVQKLSAAQPQSLEDLARGTMDLSQALRSIPSNRAFENLATGLERLNSVDFSNLNNLANTVGNLANSMSALNNATGAVSTFGTAVNNATNSMGNFVNNAQAYTNAQQQVHTATNNAGNAMQGQGNATQNLSQRMSNTVHNLSNFLDRLNQSREALDRFGSAISRAVKKVASFFSAIRNATFGKIGKDILGLSDKFETLSKKLEKVTRLFTFMLLRKGITALFSSLGTAFQHLAQKSEEFNADISELISLCGQFSHNVASLVGTLLDAFGPALNYIIELLSTAVSYVNQFLSALTGKSVIKNATKVVTDYAASLDKASNAVKSMLSGIDELNVITTSSSSGSSGSSALEDCYEELAINSKIVELAEEFKGIMSSLFDPFKTAWDNVGSKVMDSWKYAWDKIKKLASSVGSDFLKLWKEAETEKIFENILGIVSDIGIVIGNLASNFRKAWEENETGKKILEDIRDIVGIIVSGFKDMADATVEWSKNVDFRPLLTALESWLDSCKPVVDFLSGTLTDFYTTVLLPLASWTLEKGLPELLQVFIDFNNKVNWESLRSELQTLWEHVEPFMETVGEGLIIFIRDLSDALANFVNSKAFQNFLTSIEKWMDNVDAEDVANGLKLICEAIIGYKLVSTAVIGLTAAIAFINIWTTGTTGATVAAQTTAAAGGLTAFAEALSWAVAPMVLFVDTWKQVKNMESFEDKLEDNADAVGALREQYENGETSLERYRYQQDELLTSTGLLKEGQKDLVAESTIADFADEHSDALKRMKSDYENGRISISQFREELQLMSSEDSEATGVNIADGIISGMKENGDLKFGDAARWLLDKTLEKIWSVFGINSPAKEMYSTGEYIISGIIEGFKEKYDACKEAIEEWAGKVLDWFTGGDGEGDIFEKFGKFGEDIVSGFKDKVGSTYETTKTNVTAWASKVNEWFTGNNAGKVNKDTFTIYAQNVIDAFKNKVGGYYTTTRAKVVEWANKVRTWFTTDGEVNGVKFESFAVNIIDGFKGKVSLYYTEAKEGILTWGAKVLEWFNSVSGVANWEEVAANIIDGFKNKIGNLYETCKSTIQSWGSSIIGWFKETLGINSPSKVFGEFGEFIVEGLNGGIDRESDTTQTHINDWIDSFEDISADITVKFNLKEEYAKLGDYTPNFECKELQGTLADTIGIDNVLRAELGESSNLKNIVRDSLEEIISPVLENIERYTKTQAEKKETTNVYVGNREVVSSIEKQKYANGYSFTSAAM